MLSRSSPVSIAPACSTIDRELLKLELKWFTFNVDI